jgi:hypothetical protein
MFQRRRLRIDYLRGVQLLRRGELKRMRTTSAQQDYGSENQSAQLLHDLNSLVLAQ